MPYSPQEKAGLRFLKDVLSRAGYPKDVTLDRIIFRKDGNKVTPVFTPGSPTVEAILEENIHSEEADADISFAGGEAEAMWTSASENTVYFIESLDGNGRIELDERGVKPPLVDGRIMLSPEIAKLNQTKELLGAMLATYQEGENGEYTQVKPDFANPEAYSRLMRKDEKGNYKPFTIDASKCASEMMQDRLQAMADLIKTIKGNNIYIREDSGIISKLKITQSGVPFLGECDRASVKAYFEKDQPRYLDRHGAVAMFFMRIIRAIGIHWFDDKITEQEEVEALREEAELELLQDVDNYLAERQQEDEGNKRTKDIGKDALLSPSWNPLAEMVDAMMDPNSPERRHIGELKGQAKTYAIVGMFVGVLGMEDEADKVMRLLNSVTSGKPDWDDPEMKAFLRRGFAKYDAAMKAFEGKKDEFDAGPMKKLLGNAVNKLAIYAGTLVPLDNRAVMLTKIAKTLIDYSNEVPALYGSFDDYADTVHGLFAFGKLVEDGLKAQYNLANNQTKPADMQKDAGDYLAYKTAEQIVRVDYAYNQQQIENGNPIPDDAPTFLQLLGNFGIQPFQKVFMESDFGKAAVGAATNREVRVYTDLARDGYHNGNNAKIVKIAMENAKNLARMYAKTKAPKKEPDMDDLNKEKQNEKKMDEEKVTSEALVVRSSQKNQPKAAAKKPNLPQLPSV